MIDIVNKIRNYEQGKDQEEKAEAKNGKKENWLREKSPRYIWLQI